MPGRRADAWGGGLRGAGSGDEERGRCRHDGAVFPDTHEIDL
ncbi:hypothetical protein ABZU75_28315 [Streptosporangium sp. NPDC005286]